MKRIRMIIVGVPTSVFAANAQRTKLIGVATVALGILASGSFGLPARLQAQNKPDSTQQNRSTEAVEQQPATEVRAHFQQLMGERLRSRDGKMKSGWQKACTAQNGTNFYAYVRGGRVVDSAFGDEKMGALLVRIFPNGLGDATGAGKRPVGEDGGNGPSRDQCVKKLLDCINKMTSSILAKYNGTNKAIMQNLGDFAPADPPTQSFDVCLSAACKKILGIQ
jgi:hypothetical protein